MERSLKEWGRDPGLLVDLVVKKRLQMHQEEAPPEVLDTAPLPITFAPMAIIPLSAVPYAVNWGGFPVSQCWIMEVVVYMPVVLVPVPSDLDVSVYSQI